MQQHIDRPRQKLVFLSLPLLLWAVLIQGSTPARAQSSVRGFSVLTAGGADTGAGTGAEALSSASTADPAAEAESISLSNARPKQGEVIELRVKDPGATEALFLGSKYKLFTGADGVFRCLLTMPAVQKPGPAKIVVGPLSRSVTIVDAHFPVQRLTLPKSKNNFDMAKGEKEAVEGAKATLSSERLWTGNFHLPSRARISAGFGMRRIVNGVLLDDYFHSGYDFAGYQGSPIVACASGKVVLARGGFKLHGNTVAIDHGQGVVSFYIHMQKLLVKEGQTVSAGEQIGTVGQTGRANGPHLHFSIYVNQVASNPGQWFKKAL